MAKKHIRGSIDREEFLTKLGRTYAKDLTERATPAELIFKDLLEQLGVAFIFQHPVIYSKRDLMILDFYLPKYKLAFELDGWQHETKEGRKADTVRTKKLMKMGITVKRIRNFVAKQLTVETLKKYLSTKQSK